MKKQCIKFIIVISLCLSFWATPFVPLTSEITRRVRGLEPLTEAQLRLKDILDDPRAEIADQKLLVNGLLDGLLAIDAKYATVYEQKAKKLLIEIYQEVLDGKRGSFPRGIWEGKQGDINARILIRYAVEEIEGWSVDENFPSKISNWALWFDEVKLGGMLGSKFDNSPRSAFKCAYFDKFYDAQHPDKPHVMHEWDFPFKMGSGGWNTPEGDRVAREAIRHLIEDHEGWPIDENLPERARDWQKWFRKVGLEGMLVAKFGTSGRKAFQFAYPEAFYDAQHPDKPHVMHEWDFMISDWDTPEADRIAKEGIRHTVENHEGWVVDATLPVKVTQSWFFKAGIGRILGKFNGSPIEAIKFAYPEKFADGTLKESDFGHLVPGRGPASIIYHPKELGSNFSKSVDAIQYYFGPQFEGYSVGKLSDDFGGLFDSDGVLVKVFPLVKDPAITYINVVKEGLLWDVPETFNKYLLARQQGRLRLSEEEALRMAKEQLGIEPFALSLRERSALAVVVELKGIEEVKAFYHKAGLAGIKALANLPHYQTAFELL